MAGNLRTHILCYDDYRNFSEDVRKRFSDESRYKVIAFQASEEMLSYLMSEKEKTLCRIAILGLHDNHDQLSMIDKLSEGIRKYDTRTGTILLIPSDKMEEVKKAIRFNISAYIPRNANSIVRIHNTVKKLMSESSIELYRKRRDFSLTVLISFILLCLGLLIFSVFRLPQYF
jgi:DNA-binding NarL/FixJ family response regulator